MQTSLRCASCLLVALVATTCAAQFTQQPVQQPIQPAAAPMNYGEAEVQTVVQARESLDEFFGLSMEAIPPAMLDGAEGVAIFPNMIKGGFILGVNYGKGVLHVRNPDRSWSPPVMVTMGGGSVGFQAGVQAADIILVFKTPRSLNGILNGQKLTLGADASIAAGPVGRQANAATDGKLGAEIYSYARSRGLFLGVSLGGSEISIDNNANSMLYGRFGVTPADVFANRGLAVRPEVQQLINDLNVRTQPIAAAPAQQSAPAQSATGFPPQQPSAASFPAAPSVPEATGSRSLSVPTQPIPQPATRVSSVPPSQASPPLQSLAPIAVPGRGVTPINAANPPLVPITPR